MESARIEQYARLLRESPDSLDIEELETCERIVESRDTEAYDAVASVGQQLDNIPELVAVCLVYNFRNE